jgi:flagellar hook-associated protein 2
LNGGQGLAGGVFQIQTATGTATVDASGAETLRDVVDAINAQAAAGQLGIEATYDTTGTRLLLRNTGDPTATVTVSDVTGTLAADLGLVGTGATLRGSNLQRQYLSENTLLAGLNGGAGVARGQLRVTDSTGRVSTVDLRGGTLKTVGDAIRALNDSGARIHARINDTGDGLLIEDLSTGSGTLKLEDVGSTLGHDLNLLGTATNGQINGSFEYAYTLNGGESLSELMDRINANNTLVSGTILNDGSSYAPYRLNLSADASGAASEVIVDGGTTGLSFATLTRAQDARLELGNGGDTGLVITSASNTFSDVISGLTLTASGISDTAVQISVSDDPDSIAEAVSGFVDAYNAALDTLQQLSSYDPETEKGGPLLGDGTLQIIESRLFSMISGNSAGATGALTRFSQLGISFGDGGKLSFDETKFRDAYAASPDAVAAFFTDSQTGRAAALVKQIESINGAAGLLKKRNTTLDDQEQLLNERIDRMNALLDSKKQRLLAQFVAMEQALAKINTQQSALQSLGWTISTNSSSSSSKS